MRQSGKKSILLYSSILPALGFKITYMMVGLVSLFLFGLGYYILKKNNKKNTKLLRDIQPMQYFGILLCAIGLLPFIEYLIISIIIEGGEKIIDSLF